MSENKDCHCINSAFAVFADLRQAYDRMRNASNDPLVSQWFQGFIDGVNTCAERHRVTLSKCCCERKINKP